MIGFALIVFSLTGCEVKNTNVSGTVTGDNVITTWSVTEAITGKIDSWVVPVLSGSENAINEQSGVSAEVKGLIDQRKTKPTDEKKLNEEDIGLMEQIIQKVQDIGKK